MPRPNRSPPTTYTSPAPPAEAVESAGLALTVPYDGDAPPETTRRAAPALRPGTVGAQSGTAGVESVAELAGFARERGRLLYDVPVPRTREPAEAGRRLTVLAAGPAERRNRVSPWARIAPVCPSSSRGRPRNVL